MASPARWKRNRGYATVGIVAFITSLISVSAGWLNPPSLAVSWEPVSTTGYVPQARVRPGFEIALVFIGSPTCVWSNRASLPDDIEAAKLALRAQAEARGHSFAAIAVVKSSTTDDGHRYVRRFGRFDELTLGRGWSNIGLLKYVYEAFPGRAATPQLVVLERTVHLGPPRAITDERVILRRVGTKSIEDWVKLGAPLPFGTLDDTLLQPSGRDLSDHSAASGRDAG